MIIIDTIVAYCAIITPALAAILGVIALIVKAISNIRSAITKFKEEVAAIKDSEGFKENNKQLAQLLADNAEIKRLNRLLLDQLTKIRDYADNKGDQ